MTTDTEALRRAFEAFSLDGGLTPGDLEWNGRFYIVPFTQDEWLTFQAGHATAKAETAAAVAKERERAAQFCDRRQAELLALVPGARRSNVVRMHEACANTAEVLAQAIRAGAKEPSDG